MIKKQVEKKSADGSAEKVSDNRLKKTNFLVQIQRLMHENDWNRP